MTTAAVYVRISKDTEGRGLGVERQQAECRQLADRLDLEVREVFTDNDLSAYSGKRRPGYEALVEGMKAGKYAAVLCWHPDRLTRRPADLEALIDVLDATGTSVHTVSAGTYDLSTPAGRMQARVIGATSRYESEQKADRLRSKFQQMASKGDAPAGRPPFGYSRDGNTYVIDAKEAKHLRWMADRVLEGRSLSWIARTSDERGATTREGRPWHHATVRAALVNPAVAGLRVHRREVVGKGNWKPILERDRWERVVGVLADPARKHRRPRSNYPLSGLLVNVDGTRLVGRLDRGSGGEGRERRTYKTPYQGGTYVQVDADKVESLIYEAVLTAFDDVPLIEPNTSTDTTAADTLQDELDELARLRGEGVITLSEWLEARKPLERRLKEARQITPMSAPIGLDLGEPGALRREWPNLDDAARRRVLDVVLDRVTIAGAGGQGRWANLEDRVSILWKV